MAQHPAERSALKKNKDSNSPISCTHEFPDPFRFPFSATTVTFVQSMPQQPLSWTFRTESGNPTVTWERFKPGLGMHWQCFCPPFSWHVQLKIRKRNCGTLVTMRNSCLQLRRDLNPLPLHILKAGMRTTPDWNHCYNMFLLKRTAEVPGAKDMVSEAWTLASH